MDGIISHDIIQNYIFKNHDWSLSPYCAVVNIFNMNRILSNLTTTNQIYINSADSLNKIQQSKTNIKAMNIIRNDLQIDLSDKELLYVAELICTLLFDRVNKKEMPDHNQLDYLISVLKRYGIVVNNINNIIRLNRYESVNYNCSGKYIRYIIIHILRRRIENDLPELLSNQTESLLKIMCPYFTGKSRNIKPRFDKIMKAFAEYNITDKKKVLHILRSAHIK